MQDSVGLFTQQWVEGHMHSPHREGLAEDEEIIFESETNVLTNQRLFANWKSGTNAKPGDEAFLKDITDFRKITGGQVSRSKEGLIIGAVGVVFALVETFFGTSFPELIETIVFMIGALGIVIGLYLILRNFARMKPHTTIFFGVNGRTDMLVSFPGRDNPDADELIRHYSRTRRGL